MGIGLMWARLEVCKRCANYVRRSGWNWYRCEACGVDSKVHALQDLDSAYRDGPKSHCRLGKWDGIVGKTDAELAAQSIAERAARLPELSAAFIATMQPFIDKLDAAEVKSAIDQMVTDQTVPQDLHDRILQDLNLAKAK